MINAFDGRINHLRLFAVDILRAPKKPHYLCVRHNNLHLPSDELDARFAHYEEELLWLENLKGLETMTNWQSA
jgi:hypothetical protein